MKRTCKKCDVEKDIGEFSTHKHGYRYVCKSCLNKRSREQYGKNGGCFKYCVQCDLCKIFFITTAARSRKDRHFCTHYCYSLSLKGKLGAYKNLTGKKFGKWTVIKDSGERKSKEIMWLCKCDCGNYGEIAGNSLVAKNSSSCGCYRSGEFKTIDLTGRKFGRLTVLKNDGKKKQGVYWLCKCDCGEIKSILGDPIRGGLTVSCGCYNKENSVKTLRKIAVDRRIMPEGAYKMPASKRNAFYITDSYIKQMMKRGTKINDIPQSLVKLKREEIRVNRYLKEQEL